MAADDRGSANDGNCGIVEEAQRLYSAEVMSSVMCSWREDEEIVEV